MTQAKPSYEFLNSFIQHQPEDVRNIIYQWCRINKVSAPSRISDEALLVEQGYVTRATWDGTSVAVVQRVHDAYVDMVVLALSSYLPHSQITLTTSAGAAGEATLTISAKCANLQDNYNMKQAVAVRLAYELLR